MIAPIENRTSFDAANFDILHLIYKKSKHTLKFPRHDIGDGKLRVSDVRKLAAGMTYVPESFRHLVELSCKDFKLLIDGTPVRNYGVSRRDTIKVEAPQFRKSGQLSGSAIDDLVLDSGHGTEGDMGVEGKAERDERRAELSSELRQRAVVESFGYEKAPASSTPQDGLGEEADRKRNNIRKRTKAGCLTCRKRRIKCDERKPMCNNCIKSKRHCEGYSQILSLGGSTGAMQGVPVPEIESDVEIMDASYGPGPIQPSTEAHHKVVKSFTPGVKCTTCALEVKETWVFPERCCGYCGTPCVEENTLDVHDLFRATNVNDNEEWLPLTPEGPEKKKVSCPSFSINGYCKDGTDCPFIHDPAPIYTPDLSSKQHDTAEPFKSPDRKLSRKVLEALDALRALENELEVNIDAITSDDDSTTKQEERLKLIVKSYSDYARTLSCIDDLSEPGKMASRRQLREKIDKLFEKCRIEQTEM